MTKEPFPILRERIEYNLQLCGQEDIDGVVGILYELEDHGIVAFNEGGLSDKDFKKVMSVARFFVEENIDRADSVRFKAAISNVL